MKKLLFIVFLLSCLSSFAGDPKDPSRFPRELTYKYFGGNWTLSGAKNQWGNGMGFGSKSAAQLAAFTNASDTILMQVNRVTERPTFRYDVADSWSDFVLQGDRPSITGGFVSQYFATNGTAQSLPFVTPMMYGADSTGVSDSRAAFIAAFASGKEVKVGSGRYSLSDSVIVSSNQTLRGSGKLTSIVVNGNYPAFVVQGDNVTISDLRIVGGGRGTTTPFVTNRPNNNGVVVRGAGGSFGGRINVSVLNNVGDSLGNATVMVIDNFRDDRKFGVLAFGNRSTNNFIGLMGARSGEYNLWLGNNIDSCWYAFWGNGGNNDINGGSFTNNYVNIYEKRSSNDGHGSATGVMFNHAINFAVFADSLNLGYSFNGCQFFAGQIFLRGNYGVQFNDCQISVDSIVTLNNTKTVFSNPHFYNTPGYRNVGEAPVFSSITWGNGVATAGIYNQITDSLTVSGKLTVAGNIQGGSITSTGGVSGTLTTASQHNITSIGTLTGLTVTGIIKADGITLSGGITANTSTILAPVATINLTSNFSTNGTAINFTGGGGFASQLSTNGSTGKMSYTHEFEILGSGILLKPSGIITTGGLTASGAISVGGGIAGTLTTAAQPNITSVGTLSSLNVSGTVSAATLSGATINFTDATGTSAINLKKDGSNSVGGAPGFAYINSAGNRQWYIQMNASNNIAYWFYNGTAWANVATIDNSTGVFTPLSDKNKKKDLELFSGNATNAIMKLRPTLYRMKGESTTSKKHLWLLAQDVKEVIPQAYVENGNFKGIDPNPITATLIKAFQEQQKEIDELKAEIISLKKKK